MKKIFFVLLAVFIAVNVSGAMIVRGIRPHIQRWDKSFIFVSDVQSSPCHPENQAGGEAVAGAIYRHEPSFVINGGDFVEGKPAHDGVCQAAGWDNPDCSGSEDFKLFEWMWSLVINSVGKNNFYGVPGNHDFWADATWAYAHKDYYFVRSGIFFLMLNVTGSPESNIPTWDVKWVAQALASQEAQNADFRIVIFHEPGDTNRNAGWVTSPMATTIREYLFSFLRQHGVELVLNGHIHTYRRWLGNDGITYVISGGGGAGFQGDAGDVVNSTNFRHFIEFRKEFDGVVGKWRLFAKVIGIDESTPTDPQEYEIDSFELESSKK